MFQLKHVRTGDMIMKTGMVFVFIKKESNIKKERIINTIVFRYNI